MNKHGLFGYDARSEEHECTLCGGAYTEANEHGYCPQCMAEIEEANAEWKPRDEQINSNWKTFWEQL